MILTDKSSTLKSMINLAKIGIALFLAILLGCEDECQLGSNISIPFDSLVVANEDLFCFLKGPNENQVIQSQAGFDELIGCTQARNIDFESQTLLAGGMEIPTSGWVSHQHVGKNCKGGITFTVDIQAGNGQGFSTVYYFALIPKIDAGTSIIFDVTYID